jgi:hypothetical protein
VLEAAEDASDLDLLGRLMLAPAPAINCTARSWHRSQGRNDRIRLELAAA